MKPDHQLFDRTLYQLRRNTSPNFSRHDFLHREAEWRAMERLDAMNRTFDNVLIIGSATPEIASHPKLTHCIFADIAPSRLPDAPLCIVCDEEWLPCADGSLDAVISIMSLHHLNDVPGALVQMRRALKPDGMFLAITTGAQTLIEMRNVFAKAEASAGGISPRIAPFVDVRDAGNLLQRAGFALPVVDNEMLQISYATLFELMKEIRGAGENNILHDRIKHFSQRHFFLDAAHRYQQDYADDEGRITATVELLCMTAWAPHSSQQQPAKRGSGKVNLADFLGE